MSPGARRLGAPAVWPPAAMSTTLLSAFCDLDFLCKTERSLAGLSPGVLDSEAAGAPAPPEPAARPPGLAHAHSARYKTELCRPFEESGACKYGDKCQFAHGGHELRALARHPKYKTELCRTFHSAGFCPYGPRCHFIHNADERRPGPGGRGGAGARPRLRHGPASPPDSPSDPESPLSSGSLSPSGSPGLDAGRRLPIFSRLSVSDD